MGLIADQFRRDLEEMKARHAESERRLEESWGRVMATFAELQAAARDLEDC